jgi:hypothetical protein
MPTFSPPKRIRFNREQGLFLSFLRGYAAMLACQEHDTDLRGAELPHCCPRLLGVAVLSV